jgi:hypothetical protein
LRAQRRQEAEAEARAIVQGARDEAETIRTEAVRAAEAVEDAARRREQWIDEGIRLMVERAEWARRGLREVITRLDDFVVRRPEEWPEAPPIPSPPASEPPPASRMAGPPTLPESMDEVDAEPEPDEDAEEPGGAGLAPPGEEPEPDAAAEEPVAAELDEPEPERDAEDRVGAGHAPPAEEPGTTAEPEPEPEPPEERGGWRRRL